jgi:hypothetical protein
MKNTVCTHFHLNLVGPHTFRKFVRENNDIFLDSALCIHSLKSVRQLLKEINRVEAFKRFPPGFNAKVFQMTFGFDILILVHIPQALAFHISSLSSTIFLYFTFFISFFGPLYIYILLVRIVPPTWSLSFFCPYTCPQPAIFPFSSIIFS